LTGVIVSVVAGVVVVLVETFTGVCRVGVGVIVSAVVGVAAVEVLVGPVVILIGMRDVGVGPTVILTGD